MTVNVRDIDAIRDFRGRLMRFAEELEGALQAMSLELQRASEWVEQDRPHYWTRQVRRAFDQVAATRTAYQLCRLRTVAGHRSACIEEQVAHEKAKRRLQHCQEQIDRVRRWSIKIRHDADEFRGRMTGIRRLLEVDIPQALAQLDRTATILEQYAEIARPSRNDPEAGAE